MRSAYWEDSAIGKTLDLGRRIELTSMDRHCHDMSEGLYSRVADGVTRVKIHTYSSAAGSAERVEFITKALKVMAGLEEAGDEAGWLRFGCGSFHERALKRAFLDVCRLGSDAALEAKPLTVFDKKADGNLIVTAVSGGVYAVTAETVTDATRKRVVALARGYTKLCDMTLVEGRDDQVAFDCGANHDALLGLLAFRAQNVRAAMREEEQASSRGVLSAPSERK